MSRVKQRFAKYILIFILTVGVVCFCCSCAVKNKVQSTPTDTNIQDTGVDMVYMPDVKKAVDTAMSKSAYSSSVAYQLVCDVYANWLNDSYSSSVVTRCDWITALMECIGVDEAQGDYYDIDDIDLFSQSNVFVSALESGVLPKNTVRFNPFAKVTRSYAAYTLVKAAGYDEVYKADFADGSVKDRDMVSTCVYFNYFELDDDGKFNPSAMLTNDELNSIVDEIKKVNELKGKKILSFGDSIMHGTGNHYVGISDLIAQKYMMDVSDYSLGGSTFGYLSDRDQISNQIFRALMENETADVILINGGTNDMRKCRPGSVSDDFKYGKNGRADFASGMEYALGLLKDNYPDIPIVYIRSHNMVFSPEVNEIYFGNMALDICKKWDVSFVDIYNDTDFDTSNALLRDKYTACLSSKTPTKGDSVHPNRLGYFKYYIPLTVDKMLDLNI